MKTTTTTTTTNINSHACLPLSGNYLQIFSKIKKISRFSFLIFMLLAFNLSAQVTPPNADSDAECSPDCWDWFDWMAALDLSGNPIPEGDGLAEDPNCSASIEGYFEYEGSDPNGLIFPGNAIEANLQGTSKDTWTFTFDTPLTNPVIELGSAGSLLENASVVNIYDCDGTLIAGPLTGSTSYNEQLTGTYSCFMVCVDVVSDDRYTINVGTCLSNVPLPPCTACTAPTIYDYLRLTNPMGTGTGATADVELNGVVYGTATAVFSNISISEDLSGSQFGAVAQGGAVEESFILFVELCSPITVQQVDVIGLETESQVWVGTTLTGAGATAMPDGLTLTQCGGAADMAPIGNMVTNVNANCNNQGNGNYTVGAITTSTLYFRYTNPAGGCTRDRTSFRIGTCVPEAISAIPTCPLYTETYATDLEDANTYYALIRDANGNYFNGDCASIEADATAGNAIPTAAKGPCDELVDSELCGFCDPPPPCVTCGTGDYALISLNETGMGANGPEGVIEINGMCIGSFEYEYADLSIRTDANGSTFGGAEGDEGGFCLRVDFCEPQVIQQLDVVGLEVESMVSFGTAKAGTGLTASLSGLTLTHCEGSDRMDADDITNGNTVTTAGPGCLANPDASYSVGAPTVSTLYFTYVNPAGGCTRDYVGFRVGVCVDETVAPMVLPSCDVNIVEVNECPLDPNNGTVLYLQDAAGNYYDMTCPVTAPTSPLQTIQLSPCAEVINVLGACGFCDPDCNVDCGADGGRF